MNSQSDFSPKWASPPGDTIRNAIASRGMTVDTLADSLRVDRSTAAGILDGSSHLSISHARRLSSTIGGSTSFWMTREAQYRESLDWISADQWVSLLPRRDLVNLGWISAADDWRGWVSECMAVFSAPTPAELNARRSTGDRERFRARPTTPQQAATVAIWRAKVELEAKGMEGDCRQWNKEGFLSLLPELALLSKNPEPPDFIPKLQAACTSVGVAIVVLRAPKNCPVSGVAFVLSSGVRVVGLSARFLSDDHFWFTFFHEAGHLLLHDPDVIYIDDIVRDSDEPGMSGAEAEADRFAADQILPRGLREGLSVRPSPLEVRSLARSAGVSVGVVVGQLQHMGRLTYRTPLNRLKNRYVWNGATLTRESV
jgi:HTH-type transcriptional regulator / antitoxin HigA